jgi:hypothetical protein
MAFNPLRQSPPARAGNAAVSHGNPPAVSPPSAGSVVEQFKSGMRPLNHPAVVAPFGGSAGGDVRPVPQSDHGLAQGGHRR